MKFSHLFNRKHNILIDELWIDMKQIMNQRIWYKYSSRACPPMFNSKNGPNFYENKAIIVWNKKMKMMNLVELQFVSKRDSNEFVYSLSYLNRPKLSFCMNSDDYYTKIFKHKLIGISNLMKLLNLHIDDIIHPPSISDIEAFNKKSIGFVPGGVILQLQ